MLIAFKMTMPNRGSWNGKWSGENDSHIVVHNVIGKEHAKSILEKKHYRYDWLDGWSMNIEVTRVTPAEAAKIRRKSKGFPGYAWAVQSIIRRGTIDVGLLMFAVVVVTIYF